MNIPPVTPADPRSARNHAAPFLRWAGGKQWLAPRLAAALPSVSGRYFEPFLGGGSLFFTVAPSSAKLTDINVRLIETFSAVRDNPARVLYWLRQWRSNLSTYQAIRTSSFRSLTARAAQFIYLNKTCWNGLYRVNKAGGFNVPYCNDPRRATHDPEAICRASLLLQRADLQSCDFEDALSDAREGDFIYLDPPYTLLHANNGFRRYNQTLFTWDDQERLADVATRLARKGCFVVVSNSPHRDVRRLYHRFTSYSLARLSSLSADPSFRRQVHENLFLSANFPLLQFDLIK